MKAWLVRLVLVATAGAMIATSVSEWTDDYFGAATAPMFVLTPEQARASGTRERLSRWAHCCRIAGVPRRSMKSNSRRTAGRRCEETHYLELHHVEAFGLGGGHDAANLALRCAAHNALAAELELGAAYVARRRDWLAHESASAADPDVRRLLIVPRSGAG
jgi:hypothetical protein